ncbi:cadherin repeat domain-containing protein [Thalassotalea euphylliae]|uniref:cadherin repeat domain-containing protein n=1 Tax=Thalassotalea euphylliae TaxID=1655234 RepID=UPI0015F25B99|nr:cadherin repeat domain-containing protein [Thalassotalea euphylliae]
MKKSLLTTAILASLTLSACGGSSGGSDNTDPVTPAPTPNTAPTDIAIDNSSVDENSAGAVVGKLSATDAEGGAMTFTVDSDMFAVDGDDLKLAAGYAANYEQAKTMTVNVTVADADGETFSKDLTVNVNDVLDAYKFDSKFVSDASGVNYGGQTARQAQIAQLNYYIANSLQTDLDATNGPLRTRQDVINKLYSFFHLGKVGDGVDTSATDDLGQAYTLYDYDTNQANTGAGLQISFIDDAEQATVGAISGSHKDLRGKLAGNDASRMHKDWNDGSSFVGWTDGMTPTKLVAEFFKQLADNAEVQLNDDLRRDEATGEVVNTVYINTDGTDLKQLIQKFLLMGVNFSQGTDDYLDEGIGQDRDNTEARSAGATDSLLEHGYDEGFGYFGAARDYIEYSDDEIAKKGGRDDYQGKHDTDENGTIDLRSEYNFSASVNAAKRDRGSVDNSMPTDFTKDAMEAFIAAREIMRTNTTISDEQQTMIETYRDQAVMAWEKAIAATVVHYINDVTDDLEKSGTADYNSADVAKHFSEMKGFAIGLQFNKRSPLTAAQFAEIHNYMGIKPVLLPTGSADMTAVNAYIADLDKARAIFQAAYEFDAENVENW